MIQLLEKLARDETGQDLAEYGIALSVISVGVILAAQAIAAAVNELWLTGQTAVETVTN